MIGSDTPTTLALCCQLPAGMSSRDLDTCFAFGDGGMPVSWIVPPGLIREATARSAASGRPASLAVEIPPESAGGTLRSVLEQTRAAAPGIDAAWISGGLGAPERRLLVTAGIRVAGTSRFDGTRGSRRPPPPGWNCVSTAWGLWEVLWTAASPPGPFPWNRRGMGARGSLTVVNVTAGGTVDVATLCGRLDRWRSWAGRRLTTGQLVCVSFSDLPGLIAGTARRPAVGSILRAA